MENCHIFSFKPLLLYSLFLSLSSLCLHLQPSLPNQKPSGHLSLLSDHPPGYFIYSVWEGKLCQFYFLNISLICHLLSIPLLLLKRIIKYLVSTIITALLGSVPLNFTNILSFFFLLCLSEVYLKHNPLPCLNFPIICMAPPSSLTWYKVFLSCSKSFTAFSFQQMISSVPNSIFFFIILQLIVM